MSKFRPLVFALACCVAAPLVAQGFGGAVAIQGADVLVGEPDNGLVPGQVYVFRRGQGGNWTAATRLRASNASSNDGFGSAIAVNGNWALVGANKQNDGKGAVYLLQRDNRGRWTESAHFAADDAQEGDGFGDVVALGDGIFLVGAAAQDSGTGAVYVFQRQGNTWRQTAKLTASDRQTGDRFGSAIAVADGHIAIGAPGRESRQGVVFVFGAGADGAFQQMATLEPAAAEANARAGSSLLMRDGRVLVGVPGLDRFAGAVVVFGQSEQGDWREETTLRPFESGRNLQFGASLAAAGADLLVGAPGAARFDGRVYRLHYDAASETFTSAVTIAPDSLADRAAFGASLAAAGDLMVAGAVRDDNGAGTAYVFARQNDDLREAAHVKGVLNTVDPMVGSRRECADGHVGMFGCDGVDMMAFMPLASIGGSRGVQTNDIWGWTDPQTGQEWALVGRTDGTAFVDVTDPLHPRFAGSLPLTEGAHPNWWRDIKTYHNYAFIVSDGAGPHGMQVFDLTHLRGTRGEPVTFHADALYDQVASVHNIVIDTATGFAYAVGANSGGETCGGGLHMINIHDPLHPTFAGCFADPSTGRSRTGYTHDAQCVMYHGPDQDYQGHEICMGSNETALSVADVTDKQHPVAVSTASYPNVGYTHQGWFTDDQRYFYMDDELDELQGKTDGTRTLIWDVQDLDDPVLLGTYVSANKASDHNLYIVGNIMYQSNYVSGLRVFDISDRAHPRPVGFFDTMPYGKDEPGFDGSWSNYPFFASGTVIVTSGAEGLFVLRRQSPALVP